MPAFHDFNEPTQPLPAGPRGDDSPATTFGAVTQASELVRILDVYADDLRAGRLPDREKLLAEHPELAAELQKCLASIEFIHGLHKRGRESFSPGKATTSDSGLREKDSRPRGPAQLGDFRIVREIGRGGMGVVYEAEQISLKRPVALKVLSFGAVADEEAMERFRREAETIAGLHHTNIVPIFAIGSEGGVHYYAMQLIEGRSLAEVVRMRSAECGMRNREGVVSGQLSVVSSEDATDNGPLTTDNSACPIPHSALDIAEWGLQAAEALAHAHQRGVVHRDVKPSNLILDDDGRIWLTDFGLAKRQQDVTLSIAGAIMGTPRYMSPEQAAALDRAVDHRTDIYSLGATLYELATGRPIFSARSPHQVLMQILHEEPSRPRQVNPNLPKDFETIILRCLAKEPSQRYQSARELADDLRAYTEGRPIKARQAGPVERAVRWARKHRRSVALSAASAAAAVVLIVGTVLAWTGYQTSQLGQLSLSTDESQLLAEVFDEDGRPVTSGLPVPMSQPVTLPAGAYEVRLSRPGELSETWPLTVERRQHTQHRVGLTNRWLWPPLDLRGSEYPEVNPIEIDGRTDLVVVRHATTAEGRLVRTIDRLDGATGRSAWPAALAFDRQTAPEGRDANEWSRLLEYSGVLQNDPRVLDQSHDFNGDGVGDLLIASRTSASLVAISGKDGTPLWWYRSEVAPPQDVEADDVKLTYSGQSTTIAYPLLADVDGDGVVDAVSVFTVTSAQFTTTDGDKIGADKPGWIAAISGKNGEELWRYELPSGTVEYPYSSNTARPQQRTCRPRLATVDGRHAVVLVANQTLFGMDARDGSPLWPPHALGFEPLDAPRVLRIAGSQDATDAAAGRSVLLTVHASNERQAILTALHLEDRSIRWQTAALEAFSYRVPRGEERGGSFIVVQRLNAEEPESILVQFGPSETVTSRGWSGVQCLDADTREIRWERRLARDAMMELPVEQLLPGPDLDGDGTREVFVSWRTPNPGVPHMLLSVAALSGADGAMLWKHQQSVSNTYSSPEPAERMQLWQHGSDGWPLLVVPVLHGPGNQPVTFVLSSATGTLLHKLPEVARVHVADLDADGIEDLFFEQHHSAGRRLVALRGMPAVQWSRLGQWLPVHDLDRDGWTDLVQTGREGTVARSGKDGRVLWTVAALELRDGNSLGIPAPDEADLDGDGVPDFFAFDSGRFSNATGHGTFHTVSAISGRDGRKLWTAEDFGKGSGGSSGTSRGVSYSYPAVVARDLTGDGRAEALVLHSPTGSFQSLLSVLDGENGKLLWQTPMSPGAVGGWPPTHERIVRDLNGDGANDLVFWQPIGSADAHSGPRQLVAIHGNSGQPLWQALKLEESSNELGPPLVVDLDGDGQPEVVAALYRRYDRENLRYPCELVALDGRTGQVKWSWEWQGNPSVLKPLAVDFDGNGRPSICLATDRAGTKEIVVLSPTGEVEQVIPLNFERHLETAVGLWASADVNGDGKQELLHVDTDALVARTGRDVLWQWTLPDQPAEILSIHSDARGPAATIALWCGKGVYGIAGSDGKPVWRSDVPEPSLVGGASTMPEVHLLAAAGNARPNVLFTYGNHMSYMWRSVVRQAWPTDSAGRYAVPQPTRMGYERLAEELLIPASRLPWVPPGSPDGIPWWLVPAFYAGGIAPLVILVAPLWLVTWIIRRRAWHLGWLPAVYGGVCWILPYRMAAPLAIALIIPIVLLYLGIRHARYKLWFLAIAYALLALMPLSYEPQSTLADVHPWGNWWWLDELLGEHLLLAVLTLPGLFFWFALYRAARDARWKTLAAILVGSILCSVALAVVSLRFNAFADGAERFSSRGWWTIWFYGAYTTGLLALLAWLGRRGWRGLRRSLSGTYRTIDAAPQPSQSKVISS